MHLSRRFLLIDQKSFQFNYCYIRQQSFNKEFNANNSEQVNWFCKKRLNTTDMLYANFLGWRRHIKSSSITPQSSMTYRRHVEGHIPTHLDLKACITSVRDNIRDIVWCRGGQPFGPAGYNLNPKVLACQQRSYNFSPTDQI